MLRLRGTPLVVALASLLLTIPGTDSAGGVGRPSYVGPPAAAITTLDRGLEPDVVYASGSAGVFVSHDGGASWSLHSTPQQLPVGSGQLLIHAPSPDGRLLTLSRTATPWHTLQRSTTLRYLSDDGGRTWTPFSYMEFQFMNSSFPHPADPGVWYAVALTYDLDSIEECAGALSQSSRPPSPGVAALQTVPLSGRISGARGIPYLAISHDDGVSWKPIQCALPVERVTPDPDDPSAFYGLHSSWSSSDPFEGFRLLHSRDGGASWQRVEGPPTIEAYLTAEDGTLFPVEEGFLWHLVSDGTGDGLRAEPVLDLEGAVVLTDLTSPPGHPGRLYLALNTGTVVTLAVSEDGGATWRRKATEGLDFPARDLLALGNGVLLVADQGGVSISRDGGATWEPSAAGLRPAGVVDLAPDLRAPGTFLAVTGVARGRQVFRTADGGKRWESFDAGLPTTECYDVHIRQVLVHDSEAFLFLDDVCANRRRELYRRSSTDSRWTRVASLNDSPTRSSPCATDGLVLLDRYCSDDGGTTWQRLHVLHEPANVRTFPADPGRAYAWSGGRVLVTDDGGASWLVDVVLSNEIISAVVPHPGEPHEALLVSTGNGELVLRHRNGGRWTPRRRVPTCSRSAADAAYHPADPSLAVAQLCGTVHVSRDAGASWTEVAVGLPTDAPVVPDPHDRRRFFVGGYEILAVPAEPLHLGDGRFQVTAAWRDHRGRTGVATPVELTADTGWFWFFNPDNAELIVKVLDGRPVNGRFWVFAASLSNVEYEVTVTDTVSGLSANHENPAGTFASFGDTNALPAPRIVGAGGAGISVAAEPDDLPAEAVGRLPAPDDHPRGGALELHDGRFRASVDWEDFQGNAGSGVPEPLTPDTGTFWFFRPDNVEVVVKVLDGRPVNGHWWVFAGALTNVAYRLTVTDTATGQSRVYDNPSGTFASFGDTTAFAGAP